MKSDLDLCIEVFSEELERLQSLIQTCLADGNYLGAHHYSVARGNVNYQLYVLKTLKDKNYNRKRVLRESIERSKAFLKKLERETSKDKWKARIELTKKELEKLQSEITPYGFDTQFLATELQNLLDYISKNITLILKEKPSLQIRFHLEHKHLLLTLSGGNNYIRLQSLHHIGFELINEQLQLRIPEFDKHTINDVVEICSRIIYEGCFFYELDKEMKLICD